jgi:[FeFe] hydrogenase (group B1/B3)
MNPRKFDTNVQHIKYKVLREVARPYWDGRLIEAISDIPKTIIPGKESTMRCCVYKERAIVGERVKLAMGGDRDNPNVIEVIDIACDECPKSGYDVTDFCRGCIAHRCEAACKFGAISFDDNQKAVIDKKKCVNCGACAKACPYTAIINRRRPCENACKVKAIHMGENGEAEIDNSKCVACGACVYQCPFGAVMDKSFILDTIDLLNNSKNNSAYNVYAVVAPSIAAQFSYAKLGQVVSGIKKLGFYNVAEVALGADMVASKEARELAETEDFLTSSCCPAFVDYINKNFPQLKEHVSHNLSPMAEIGRFLKERDPECKIVFIGPCTAKKKEIQLEKVAPYIDNVITFEELQALLDSRDIYVSELPEEELNGASCFGRIFARSGGLAEAVKEGLKENGDEGFDYRPVSCSGIDECKVALLKASKGLLKENFIEGMACEGGCVGGAGCLTHQISNSKAIDKYGSDAGEKTIKEAVEEAIK